MKNGKLGIEIWREEKKNTHLNEKTKKIKNEIKQKNNGILKWDALGKNCDKTSIYSKKKVRKSEI